MKKWQWVVIGILFVILGQFFGLTPRLFNITCTEMPGMRQTYTRCVLGVFSYEILSFIFVVLGLSFIVMGIMGLDRSKATKRKKKK